MDEATRQEQGKSLFQLHEPEHTRVIRRTPFESAVHAYPRTEIEIAATHYWTNVQPLTEILNSIVKHADNVLREQAGYKYRVRGIQLTDKCKAIIEAALQPERPKREISIDHAKIEQLAKDSEALRARLLAAEAPENESQDVEEAPFDEEFAAAAIWAPQSPALESAPMPAEAITNPNAGIAAIDWSRIGGRRRARAMLRLRRFGRGGIVGAARQSGQSSQLRSPPDGRTQVPARGMENASANGDNIAGAASRVWLSRQTRRYARRPVDRPG